MKNWHAYIAIIVAMIIWSASGIAIKISLVSFTPITLIVLRFTLAVVLMLLVGLIAKSGQLHLVKLRKQDIGLFLLGGFFQPFLYYVLETYAYKSLASPTIAEALLSTSPLIAPIFAFLFIRERVTVNNIVGILISTLGMLLLVLNIGTDFSLGSPWGILLAFLSVSTAVCYTIVLRKMPSYYNALSIVFYVQLVSLLFFYPMWAIMDLPQLTIPAVDPTLWKSLGGVIYLAVFSSVTAFILFCYTVRQIGVTRANAFNNIRPVFTALIMLFFFEEQLPWQKWLGIIVIIAGLFICQSTISRSGNCRKS